MRLIDVLLFIAIIIFASTDAASMDGHSEILGTKVIKLTSPASVQSLNDGQGMTIQRLLRIHEIFEDNEERGVVTAVEKFKELLTSSKVSQKTLERWVRNKKSPKQALIRLNLGKAGQKLFENPQFNTWVKYVTMLKKDQPEAAMVTALMTRYSDEALSKVLEAATKVPGTKEVATKLQNAHIKIWQESGKSANDVFKLLQLRLLENLFDSPQFKMWTKYVTALDDRNTAKVMLSTLSLHYTEQALANMIQLAKMKPITEKIATKLEIEQIFVWLSNNKRAEEVYWLLGLDMPRVGFLGTPIFRTWAAYANALKPGNEEAAILPTLLKAYGDKTLAKLLQESMTYPATKTMATNLYNELIKKAPADKVSKVLQPKLASNKLLESPQFAALFKQANLINKENPEAVMISTLMAHYSDEVLSSMLIAAKDVPGTARLATKLQSEQIKVWLSKGKPANEVFKYLQLNLARDEGLAKLFISPLFGTWTKYVDDLTAEKATPMMFSSLSTHYPDEELAKMIIAAKDVEKTKPLAAGLQREQLSHWLDKKITPRQVYTWMGVKAMAIDSTERAVWRQYLSDYNKVTATRLRV